jgi:tRNA A37 threonylcarbamoyladenosine biosynthesis protein TsaE
MDAYRLDSTPEAEELDLDSMLAEGALIIEWPERMAGLIPAERLWVNLEHSAIKRAWFQRVSPCGPKKSARMLLSRP